MTQYPDLFAALAAPFETQEVKVRTQAGRQLHYITARTAMNRLDNVLGPENWWDEYVPGENSVLCRLTIRLPDGSTLTKSDAGGYAGMADSGDDDKSGYSDAFKRAAVEVRRRPLPLPRRRPRVRPASASPRRRGRPRPQPAPRPRRPGQRRRRRRPTRDHGRHGNVPRTGKALFAWTKDQEQRHEVGLLKYLNSWAKLQDFPGRMVDWDAEQVGLAYAEACRKLQSIGSGTPRLTRRR